MSFLLRLQWCCRYFALLKADDSHRLLSHRDQAAAVVLVEVSPMASSTLAYHLRGFNSPLQGSQTLAPINIPAHLGNGGKQRESGWRWMPKIYILPPSNINKTTVLLNYQSCWLFVRNPMFPSRIIHFILLLGIWSLKFTSLWSNITK